MPAWREVVKRLVPVLVAGVAIYIVLPSLTRVMASWPRLSTLNPVWFAVALGAEVAHFMCTFALQRLALRTSRWFPVVTSELAGNAMSLVIPGGGAAGAAVQFRMLQDAGIDTDTAVSGLTAFSLIQVGGLLALPVVALPAIFGAGVSAGLVHSAVLGLAGFVLFAAFGYVIMRYDRPLALIGRVIQRVWNRISRGRKRLTGLDRRMLRDRDDVRSVLGANWRQAVLLCTARLAFDYGCLLAVLRATGAHPRPALVLLAYAAANIIELFPITPGGLGIVEAGLSGMLILAGVPAGNAFLATLGYRIASYWLPLLAGPFAYIAFRLHYRTPAPS